MPKITYRNKPVIRKKLTIKQKKFVDKYIETGNKAEAVMQAGYNCKDKERARYIGYKNTTKKHIIDAIEEKEVDMQQKFKDIAHKAFEVMADLMINANSEKVKQSSAKDLLDRAGYSPTAKQEITGKDGQALQIDNTLLVDFANRARNLLATKDEHEQ